MPARLKVIAGPMFSGKSTRLISEIHAARHAHKDVLVLKPKRDTRTKNFVESRSIEGKISRTTGRMPAQVLSSRRDFVRLTSVRKYDVVVVDEAHFFPLDRPRCDSLGWFGRAVRDLFLLRRSSNLLIVVAGLDLDYELEPFGPIPGLLALATEPEKVTAVCMMCGAPAHFSQKIDFSRHSKQIEVGDCEKYEARCAACFGLVDTLNVSR